MRLVGTKLDPKSSIDLHELFHSLGNGFPIDVIEVEKESYKLQSKTKMHVVSAEKGNYHGPKKLCPARWEHIKEWHLVIPKHQQLKLINSLHRPHYSLNEDESEQVIPAMMQHVRKNRAKSIHVHLPNKNHIGNQVILLNDVGTMTSDLRIKRDPTEVAGMVRLLGVGDKNRLNHYVDGGFSGHQNATDRDEKGIVRPRLLKNTRDPVVLDMFCWLSAVVDKACARLGKQPLFRDFNGSPTHWARQIHPSNTMEANRHALGRRMSSYQVHEDGNNGHGSHAWVAIYTDYGDFGSGETERLCQIGYMRHSCTLADERTKTFLPIVDKFVKWTRTIPKERADVVSQTIKNGQLKEGEWVCVDPCLDRTYVVSTYIDLSLKLQKKHEWNRDQLAAFAAQSVTMETPHFLWLFVQEDKTVLAEAPPEVIACHYHDGAWKKRRGFQTAMPGRKHQLHNSTPATREATAASIANLLELVNSLWMLDPNEVQKQFYHSKSLGILQRGWREHGFRGAGPLTSQTLLHVLASLNVIPRCMARWGEIVVSGRTHARLVELGLPDDSDALDQLVRTLSSTLGWTENKVEHAACKFGRNLAGTETNGFTDIQYCKQSTFEVDFSTNSLLAHKVHAGRLATKVLATKDTTWVSTARKLKLGSSIWDLRTRKKTHGKSKARGTSADVRFVNMTDADCARLMPSRLQLASVAPNDVNSFHLRQLLSQAYSETTVTKSMVQVHRKSKPSKHVVPTVHIGNKQHSVATKNRHQIGMEAKRSAIFNLVVKRDPNLLKKRLAKLLSKRAVSDTLDDDVYFPTASDKSKHERRKKWITLCDSDHGKKNAREVMAVVVRQTRYKILLALVDEFYLTKNMEVFQL